MSALLPLRSYQRAALDAVTESLTEVNRPAIVLPTGGGKTVCFAHMAAEHLSRRPGTRVLVLVHTDELVNQAHAKIRAVAPHLVVGIVKGPRNEVKADVIVASVQSLRSVKRRAAILHVSLVIVDECFPAGTLVGGKPIESLRPGDLVPSWDEVSGREVLRPVVALMKSVPAAMVRVEFDDGTDLTCTPNHPLLTMDGWLPAGALMRGERVISFTHDATARGDLHGVPDHVRRGGQSEDRRVPEIGPDVLHGRVPGLVGEAGPFGADGSHEQGARLRAHDRAQPDAFGGDTREDVRDAPADQPQATGARRERLGTDGAAGEAGGTAGMAHGSHDHAEGRAAPLPLLGGHRASDDEGVRGGGRGVTLSAGTPSLRPEAGRAVALRRVARVQDLQPGRDGTYGGVCPDGYVYNVEVAGTHTYLVGDGVVAHNCHHATARTYRTILEHYGCMAQTVAVGFTATLERGDGGPLGEIWQRVAFTRDIAWMVRKGYLIPPRGKRVEVPELDLSKVRTSGGDFREGDLGSALVDSLAPDIIAKAFLEHASGRKALAFFPTVASAEVMVEAFRANGVDSRVIHGGLSTEDRRATLAWHKRGTVLVNCMILTEGFDDPEVDCIIMARPTKSKPLYIQIVGRGLRVDPNRPYADQDCLLMDVVGVSARMDLRSMADLSEKEVKPPKDGQTLLDLEDAFDAGEGAPEPDEAEHYAGPVEVKDFDPIAAKSSRAWLRTDGGAYFLPAGKDGYVFLVPAGSGPYTVAWCTKASRTPWVCPLSTHDQDCTSRHGKLGALTEHAGLDLEMALTWGEDLAVDMGADPYETLTRKAAPWRRKPASEPAKREAQRLGIKFGEKVKGGELSDRISKVKASGRIDPVVKVLAQQVSRSQEAAA